jgi:hypothetical protein
LARFSSRVSSQIQVAPGVSARRLRSGNGPLRSHQIGGEVAPADDGAYVDVSQSPKLAAQLARS